MTSGPARDGDGGKGFLPETGDQLRVVAYKVRKDYLDRQLGL